MSSDSSSHACANSCQCGSAPNGKLPIYDARESSSTLNVGLNANGSRSLRIDVHTHVLPESWPDLKERYGYPGWINMKADTGCSRKAHMVRDDGTHFRTVEDNLWSMERRVEDSDKIGVDVQVLSTVPVMFSYWAKPEHTLDLSMLLNDHIAACVDKHPTRFVGLGTIPMQDPDLAVQELKRCKEVLGLAGVQIGSHVNDKSLSDPSFFKIFKAAEEIGAAIFVHPWDMMGKELMPKYFLPWLVGMPAETSLAICSMIFSGIFEKLPNLRVCFAHGGGAFPGTLARIEHGFRVRPDICAVDCTLSPMEQMGKFWVDSLVHSQRDLNTIVEVFGEDKICLGSDYPFPLGEFTPESQGKVYAAGSLLDSMAELAAQEEKDGVTSNAEWRRDGQRQRRIFSMNALDWLGLKEEDFLPK